MIDFTTHSELIIRQEVEQIEIFTGFESANRYSILTPDGNQLLYAYEDSGDMSRQFMGTHRPLSIHIVDNSRQPVLEASRDFFWMLSHLRVDDPAGRRIGMLNRRLGLGRKFDLVDGNDRFVAQITSGMFQAFTFTAKDGSGNELGRVTKQWSGFGREMFTDADTFQVQYTDGSTDHDFRAMLLASAFAIDMDFFESKG